jgi:hypothetical protein
MVLKCDGERLAFGHGGVGGRRLSCREGHRAPLNLGQLHLVPLPQYKTLASTANTAHSTRPMSWSVTRLLIQIY